MTNTTTSLEELAAEYQAAADLADQTAKDDCSVSCLRSVWTTHKPACWVDTKAHLQAAYGITGCPTEENVERVRELRLQRHQVRVELGQRLYRALLEAGLAYHVVDHSDRLDSRPFEIRPADLPYVPKSFLTAHGSSIRLARYGTEAAAEKALVKLMAKELERVSRSGSTATTAPTSS